MMIRPKIKEQPNEDRRSVIKSVARKAAAVALAASLSIGAGAAFGSSNSIPIAADAYATQTCSGQVAAATQISLDHTVDPVIANADNKAMSALQKMYNPSTGLFNGAQWWQQPVILQTIMDYSQLSHNYKYMGDVCRTFVLNRGGNFLNAFNDDEGWWAQAWLQAYGMTKNPQYLGMAKSLFNNMSESWNGECGGGILWYKYGPYKNAIANELFMSVALSLYSATGDKAYLDWSFKEYDWFMRTGLLGRSNQVKDGLGRGCVAGGGIWTYNQGELIGALTRLTRITGNKLYIGKAEAIATSNDAESTGKSGTLHEIGCAHTSHCNISTDNLGSGNSKRTTGFSVDNAQFKGIYIMNLYYMYQTDHNAAYLDFILKNARAIESKDNNGRNIIGLNWSDPSRYWSVTEASTQASGIAALNAGQ